MVNQEIAINEDFKGYLSIPSFTNAPGIVLIQDIFGVNDVLKTIADHFARAGFMVLAPDLYWRMAPNVQLGYEAQDVQQAFEYYKRYNVSEGIKDIGLAVETLKNYLGCSGKIALLGLSFGAKLAYLAAAESEVQANAAVAFYPAGIIDHLKIVSEIQCPLQFHFGEKDEMITSDQVTRIKAAFRDKENVETHVYAGTGHAFYNHARPTYHLEASKLAYQRTISFLSYALQFETTNIMA